jgi:hypothetical protein
VGAGFYAQFLADTPRTLTGWSLPASASCTIGLKRGWNLLSSPYQAPLVLSQLATSPAGVLEPVAWGWDGSQYHQITESGGPPGTTHQVEPWEGFFVHASQDCDLTFAPPGTAAVQARATKAERGGWQVRILAEGAGRRDGANVGGTTGGGPDRRVLNPPGIPQSVDAFFVDPGAPGRLASDLRAGERRAHSWQLVVASDLPDGDLSVSWQGIATVPPGVGLTFYDPATDRRLDMRATSSYSFRSGSQGADRRFIIEAAPRAERALVIHSLSAQPARGGGVSLQFVVTQPCRLDAVLANMAGRSVAQLRQGEAVPAGMRALAWDGRSAGGARVPAGRYLLRLRARGQDGAEASAVTPVDLRR